MKTILVPTDFSDASQWAIEVATGIAKKSNAEIILLHIIDEPMKQSFSVAGEWELSQDFDNRMFILELVKRRKDELNSLALGIQDGGVKVSMQLKFGTPYDSISTTASRHLVDLVVMGTNGHTRFERIFGESTTDKVIRKSRLPVLTVHERTDGQLFKNIVCVTSIDDAETPFSRILKVAQRLYDSTIHLVRINTRSNFLPDRKIRKILDEFACRMHLVNYTVNIFNDTTEQDGILHFAESVQADLIGLTTYARSKFELLIKESVSDSIINCSKKPVLTYIGNR